MATDYPVTVDVEGILSRPRLSRADAAALRYALRLAWLAGWEAGRDAAARVAFGRQMDYERLAIQDSAAGNENLAMAGRRAAIALRATVDYVRSLPVPEPPAR